MYPLSQNVSKCHKLDFNLLFANKIKISPVFITLKTFIRLYIHIHVFRPSQDSSVWLWLTSREQLMSPECSKHQVLSFAKMLVVWWTNKKYSVLIIVLQSAQWINSERIYKINYSPEKHGKQVIKHQNKFLTFKVATKL